MSDPTIKEILHAADGIKETAAEFESYETLRLRTDLAIVTARAEMAESERDHYKRAFEEATKEPPATAALVRRLLGLESDAAGLRRFAELMAATCRQSACHCIARDAEHALSSDAGKSILAVVECARAIYMFWRNGCGSNSQLERLMEAQGDALRAFDKGRTETRNEPV